MKESVAIRGLLGEGDDKVLSKKERNQKLVGDLLSKKESWKAKSWSWMNTTNYLGLLLIVPYETDFAFLEWK